MSRILAVSLLFVATVACDGGGLQGYNDPDGDTDADADSDTDADADADSDTDVGGNAPTMVSFEAREMGSVIQVAFRVTDPDGDLDGGSLELIVDGTPFDLAIPGDIGVWNPSGESTVDIPVSVCDTGTHSFAGRIYDAGGHSSAQMSDSVTLAGFAEYVSETGDDNVSATDLGMITPPTWVCGDLYAASNDSAGYTGDQDWIIVEPASSGQWTYTLTWDAPGSDYDLHILDSLGVGIASSILDGDTQPETVDVFMWSGDFYYAIVAGWNGSGGDWTLTIQ